MLYPTSLYGSVSQGLELLISRIWLAEIYFDYGLDFPT